MCGLFGGLSTYLGRPEVERIAQLAYLSALRGTDSTGMAFGFRKKKEKGKFGVYTHKMVVSAPAYLEDKTTQNLLGTNVFFIMGHCRASTIGASNIDNAHPHECEHITGTHNGTIGKWGNTTKSDSRVLFEKVATDGVAKAFGEADDGAYATVFADRRARTLNFFRNDKRPLFLVWNKAGNSLLWASEREMLELVAARTNFTPDEIWSLREHTLYQVPFGTTDEKVDEIKLIKPAIISRQTFFPPSRNRWAGDPAFKGEPWDDDDTVEKRIDQGLAQRINSNHTPAGLHQFPKDKHYDSEFYKCFPTKYVISTEDAKILLEGGCSGCGGKHKLDDTLLTWYDHETFLCGPCEASEFHQIYSTPKVEHEVKCG